MKHFGTTFNETIMALKPHLGIEKNIEKKYALTRIVLSFIMLFAGIFFIVKPDIIPGSAPSKDIGELLLGAIIGYWLK
jgi:hypothetical protein